jgi:glycosyltransferase involved in cell wall biosynthesis
MRSESVSIVVPTFREPDLTAALTRLVGHLRTIPGYSFDVLVVDDSEPETQARLVEEIARLQAALGAEVPMRVLCGPRRGKGAAVRVGATQATGSVVFTIDADLPVLLSHVEEFLRTIETTGADVVIGERARDRYAGDPVRDVVARTLRLLQQGLVFHRAAFEDTQCGFKAFRTSALRAIVDRQIVDGGMYDLEYLYAATLRGLNVQRVPVKSTPQVRPSRIRVLRCVVLDPIDIVRLKVSGLRGHYR